ncbi:helix-turn-helix domain-containing protein [Streptomyces coeruleorubidus]|uniref:helix-turn-helix domain-containing protein n=1 Tax=Streptomyces coeruleorubidus TaxID=116188 RepID=UPI00380D0BC4
MGHGNTLGGLLARQRMDAGWSQEELADRSGVSVRTVRNIETGAVQSPRHSSLSLVVAAFQAAGRFEAEYVLRDFTDRNGIEKSVALSGRSAGVSASNGVRAGDDHEWLVGRKNDISRMCESLPRDRWTTLVGPGGVGKTKLAFAVADRLRSQFAGGVSVVNLGEKSEDHETAIWRAVCEALLSEGSPGDASEAMRRLVVIDNIEHLQTPAVRVCQRLLAEFPDLWILITSRHAVAAAGVKTVEVRPLSPVDAERLFLYRAQAACPDLDLTGRGSAVTEICRKLDGLPFALEVAALRLRSLSIDTLLEAPVRQIVAQPSVAGLPHQRTLVESVTWSYGMLGEEQRRLLHWLSAFLEAFTIKDLLGRPDREAVADDFPHLFDLVSDLVDRSMLQVCRGAEYRYSMLGHIREVIGILQ